MIDEQLKIILYTAWRMGSIGSGDTEETDKEAFEEWYNNDLPHMYLNSDIEKNVKEATDKYDLNGWEQEGYRKALKNLL